MSVVVSQWSDGGRRWDPVTVIVQGHHVPSGRAFRHLAVRQSERVGPSRVSRARTALPSPAEHVGRGRVEPCAQGPPSFSLGRTSQVNGGTSQKRVRGEPARGPGATVPRSGAALLSPPLSCHVSPTSIFRLGMFKTGDRIRCRGQIETPVRKSCDSDGFFSSVSQAFDEHHLAAGVGPRTGAHPAVTLRLHTLLLHHERVGSRYERRT